MDAYEARSLTITARADLPSNPGAAAVWKLFRERVREAAMDGEHSVTCDVYPGDYCDPGAIAVDPVARSRYEAEKDAIVESLVAHVRSRGFRCETEPEWSEEHQEGYVVVTVAWGDPH